MNIFSTPAAYNEKMKLATLHFNTLQIEKMLGTRKEKSNSRASVKGRDTQAVKRKMTQADHDWRNAIYLRSISIYQERHQERRLMSMGAPSSTVLQELLREEEEITEQERRAEEEDEDKREDGVAEEERVNEEEGDMIVLNGWGLEEEWVEESEGEERDQSAPENDQDSADQEEEEEWHLDTHLEGSETVRLGAATRGRGARGRGNATRGRGAKVERGVKEKKGEEKVTREGQAKKRKRKKEYSDESD